MSPSLSWPQPKTFSLSPHWDKRGFFIETFHIKKLEKENISFSLVQINQSFNYHLHTLRGLHYQKDPWAQSKIIQVITGSIWDVSVDLRKNSPTFGQTFSFYLKAEDFTFLYLPPGFAHGFCTLTPFTLIQYGVDKPYNPQMEAGLRWNDPYLKITWPCQKPILSAKDKNWPFFEKTFLKKCES